MIKFKNNEINLSEIKNKKEGLFNIGKALYFLSESCVNLSSICLGGFYHKNYYNFIYSGFKTENSCVFVEKTGILSKFLTNLKNNLCNYGVFFYKRNNNLYIKIYSGNCVKLGETQQNFICSKLNSKFDFENFKVEFLKTKNYYKIEKLNLNLKIFNPDLKSILKNCYNTKSDFLIKIYKNLNYKIYFKNTEIEKENLFKNFHKVKQFDDKTIENLIKNNYSNVVNENFLMYNDYIYNFDIIKTLKYLEKKLSDNYRRLV